MKERYFMQGNSLFALLISLFTIKLSVAQTLAINDQNTCSEFMLVRSYYNPKEYIQVCTECNFESVLSYDLQKCTPYTDLSNNNLQFCKRIGRDGCCIEALCAIQLNELNVFVSQLNGHSDENCARFDSQSGKCLYPRLKYVLDIDSQTIENDEDTYCAIIQNGICIEYHSSIINISGVSYMLDQFEGSEYIDRSISGLDTIYCLENYELINLDICDQNLNDLVIRRFYGCVIYYKIPHCILYNKYTRQCIQCEKGYSLNSNGKECVPLKHCLKHVVIFGRYYCIKCEPFYYLEHGQCYPHIHCEVQADDSYCAFCTAPYYGYRCEIINNNNIANGCELLNRNGNCVRCKDNDINFYHIYNNQCQPRVFSLYCCKKSYISDQCDSLECQDGYYFNTAHLEFYYGAFVNLEKYSTQYLEADLSSTPSDWQWYDNNYQDYIAIINPIRDTYYNKYYFNKGKYPDLPFCQIRKYTIKHCIVYDRCYESCLQCEDGYQLVQRSDFLAEFYYRFICLKIDLSLAVDILFCYAYNLQHTQCTQCIDYYYSNLSSCQPGTVNHCRVYGIGNNCLKCEKNYALFNNQCFYVELCIDYQWQEYNLYCNRCIERPDTSIALFSSSERLRQDCVINLPNIYCIQYLDNICLRCQKGYVLFDDQNICIPEIKSIPHCLKVNYDHQCIACVYGYKLINGRCFKIGGSCKIRYNCDLDGCQVSCNGLYINGKWTCQYDCPDNYGIYYNKCQLCTDQYGEGCQKCNCNQVCEICKDGYFWDERARKCKYTCPNGLIVEFASQCSTCNIQNCQNCPQPDICQTCLNDYFLQDNSCVSDCSDGYNKFISFNNNRCIKCQDPCVQCLLDKNFQIQCTRCKDGWTVGAGVCVQICQYFIVNGICTDICDNYIQGTSCIQKCPNYYIVKKNNNYIDQRYCVDICEYLLYDDNPNECTQICRDGYRLNAQTRKCEKCAIPNCTRCSEGVNTCDYCCPPYFYSQGKCLYVCEDSNRQVEDPFDCQKCSITGCKNDCFYDGTCNMCQQNYILDQQSCRCPTENGFFLQYPDNCSQCSIDNCLACSDNENCSQCKLGYFLSKYNGTDYLFGYWEKSVCLSTCQDGYFGSNGQCYPCIDNCLSCTQQDNCYKCRDGYIQQITSTPANGIFTTTIQCVFVCYDGSTAVTPDLCPCKDPNCKLCEKSPDVCSVCALGYQLNSNQVCEFITTCSLTGCDLCDPTGVVCLRCQSGYHAVQGLCRLICYDGSLADENGNCLKSDLCQAPYCVKCLDGSNTQCEKCISGYVVDQQSFECVLECQRQVYDFYQICLPCPYQCLTCDYFGNCLKCKGSNTLETNCLCAPGYKFYKNRCVKKCPFYSQKFDKYCIEFCVDGLFPYYTFNREQRLCQLVQSENSNFCLQNLENFTDLVNFSLETVLETDDQYYLHIDIEQTPSLCYTYIFRGVGDTTFDVELLSEVPDLTSYQVRIPSNAMLNNLLSCNDLVCTAQLEVYYAEVVQFIIYVTIKFEINIFITNGVKYQGSYQAFNAVCPTCAIPITKLVSSNVKVICPTGNICSDSSIKTTTNSQIQIIQQISDVRFLNNKLQPHSLKLLYQNSQGDQQEIQIANYYYDNSQLGSITYTFVAIALKPGLLVVTSFCNNAVVSSLTPGRLLADNSEIDDNVVYPQIKIPFEIINTEKDQPVQNNSINSNVTQVTDNKIAIIISSCIGGLILLIILAIIGYKIHYKKMGQKNTSHLSPASTTIAKQSELESLPVKKESNEYETKTRQEQIVPGDLDNVMFC